MGRQGMGVGLVWTTFGLPVESQAGVVRAVAADMMIRLRPIIN